MAPRLKTGIAANTGGELTGRLLAGLSGILMAKALPPTDLGSFFSAQAAVLVGAGLYNLGVVQGYRQLTARDPERRDVLAPATVVMRTSALILYGAIILMILSRSPGGLTGSAALVVAGTLGLSFAELAQTDFLVRQRYGAAAVVAIAKGGVLFLPALLMWFGTVGYRGFTALYSAAVGLIVLVALRQVLAGTRRPNREEFGELVRTSAPFILSIAAYAVSMSFGLSWIGARGDSQVAGIVGVAWKVYQLTLVVALSVSAVLLPVMHRLAARDEESSLIGTTSKALRLGMGGAVVVGAIFSLGSERVVRWVASDAYSEAAGLLPWLAVALLLRVASVPLENLLEAQRRQRARIAVLAAGAAVTVTMVVLFLPTRGGLAVAWGAAAADATVFLGMAAFTWKSGRTLFRDVLAVLVLASGFLWVAAG